MRYVSNRTRRRRRSGAAILVWLIAVCATGGFVVIREPSIIPGAAGFIEHATVFRDLLLLRHSVKAQVKAAEFWGSDLLVVATEIENRSRFVLLCQDLRLLDRAGRRYLPSSTSAYYVNRSQSLWMRQVNPGERIEGRFAFSVPDGAFGLCLGIETPAGMVRLAPISEISRRRS